MALRIRLVDADRERYGCPEWVELATSTLTLREAATVQRECGFDSPEALRAGLRGTPTLDADGRPVLDAEGRPRRRVDYEAWAAAVWISLRRAGVTVPFAEFDIQDGFAIESDEPVEDEPGKDQAAADETSTG